MHIANFRKFFFVIECMCTLSLAAIFSVRTRRKQRNIKKDSFYYQLCSFIFPKLYLHNHVHSLLGDYQFLLIGIFIES